MAQEGQGLYRVLEDKYYDFLDKLESAGIPVYKIVDPIEEKNIPTFPIAVLLVLLVVAGIGFLLLSTFFVAQSELVVYVQDEAGNPVSGALISISDGTKIIAQDVQSRGDGSADFLVPRGVELTINVSKKPDFQDRARQVTLEKDRDTTTVDLVSSIVSLRKTVRLLKPGSSELFEEPLEVSFSCSQNSLFSLTKTNSGGLIEIDVPSNCGLLRASLSEGLLLERDSFDLGSGQTIEMRLQEQEVGKGDVLVTVRDSSENSLAGIRVNLLARNSSGVGSIQRFGDTSSTGSAVFSDVPEGSYFVTVSDPTGNFAEFDSSSTGDIKGLSENGSISFAVMLERKIIGSIKLVVKDKQSLEPIENAAVALSKGSTLIGSDYTGADGKVEFGVGEQLSYNIVVDKAGYLIEAREVAPSAQQVEVFLDKATLQNSQSFLVEIVDEVGKPVENARVSLRLAEDDTQVGNELVTGTTGKVLFQRVKEGRYYVSALKPGFGEATSQTIELSTRQENSLQLTLEIGFGNVEVNVLDDSKQPLPGANVSLVDFFTGDVLEQGVTNSDGVTTVTARADKTAFVVVTSSGFLPYTTVPVAIGKDVTRSVAVEMRKEIQSLSLEFVGLFVAGQIVRDSITPALDAGQKYTAKFLLLVPSGSSFEQAGTHIRTGDALDGVANIIEKDSLFIGDARGAFNSSLRGTSFSPPAGLSADAAHYTTGQAKWAEMVFNRPSNGVYEIEADLQVRENARQGAILDLWYRAFGKSGSYVRFPSDDVLGSNENTAAKQGLYAQAKNKKFSVGPTNLCNDDFCASVLIENVAQGVQTSVVDEFSAEVSSKYRLKFSVTSVSNRVFSASEVIVEDQSDAVEMSHYEITGVSGSKTESSAVGAKITAQVGDISKNDLFSGIVDFEPKTDGTTTLKIQVLGGDGAKELVFEKEILLNIVPAQEMNVEVVPKIIVPFINNNVMIMVSNPQNENPLANAFVTVKNNAAVIANGQTNSNGIFPFTVNSPNAGEVISVLVVKRGFKPVQLEMKLSENILSSLPEKLKETLIVGEAPEKDTIVSFLNQTQIPLVIDSVQASSEFADLVVFDFDSSLLGATLDVNGSVDAPILLSLTGKAESLERPATIQGSINVVVTNTELEKSWSTSIPAEIRIGFGQEVDESDCLSITPSSWDIFTSTQEVKQLKVVLENDCRVGGQPVALGALEAKLNLGSENSVGEFRVAIDVGKKDDEEKTTASLSGTEHKTILLQDTSGITLQTQFAQLLESVPANAQADITIEFKPNQIASASQKISIDLRASHQAQKGVERIKNSIKVNLNVNDLAACVSISPKDTLRLLSCPFNTGYGQFPQNFSGTYQFGGYPQQYNSGFGNTFGGGTGFGYGQYPGYYGTGATGNYYGNTMANPTNNPLYPDYGAQLGLQRMYGNQNIQYGFSNGFGQSSLNNPQLTGFDPFQTQLGYNGSLPSYLVQNPQYASASQSLAPGYGNYMNRTYPYNNYSAPFFGGDNFNPDYSQQFGCGQAPIRVANNCSVPVELGFEGGQAVMVDKPTLSLEKGAQATVNVKPAYFAGVYPIDVSAKFSSSSQTPQPIAQVLVNIENSLVQGYRDCISINPVRKLKFNSFFGKPVTLQVMNSCYNRGVRLLRTNDTIFFPSSSIRAPTDITGSGPNDMIENWALLDESIQSSAGGQAMQVQTFEVFKALKNYCDTLPTMPQFNSGQSPIAEVGNLRYFFSQGYYSVQNRTNLIVNFYSEFGTRQSVSFPLEIEDWWEALPLLGALGELNQGAGGGAGGVSVNFGDPNISPAACINPQKIVFKGSSSDCMSESEFEALEKKGYTTSAYTVPSGSATVPLKSIPSTGGGLLNVATPNRYLNNCEGYFSRYGFQNTLGLNARTTPFDSGPTYYPSYITSDPKTSPQYSQRNTLPYYIQPSGSATSPNYHPSYINGIESPPAYASASYPAQQFVSGCGSLDTITDVSPTTIERNGIRIKITVVGQKELKVEFDASKWKEAGKPKVEFEETVTGTVRRVNPPASEQFRVPLKFCLEKGKTEPPKPPEAQMCSAGGETGTAVFKKYGFGKIKFDWRAEQISANECDTTNPAGIYCDATQFSIALNKKAKEIKKLADNLTLKCKIEGTASDSEEQKYCSNSKEMFRNLAEYVLITEDTIASDHRYQFFADQSKNLIENSGLKQEFSKKFSDLKGNIVEKDLASADARKNVIKNTLDLLEKIAKEKQSLEGGEVLVLLAQDSLEKEKYQPVLDDLGIDFKEIGSQKFYVMTLKEFREFFSNLDAASKDTSKECSTAVKDNCFETKDASGNITVVRVKEIFKGGQKDGVRIDTEFLSDFKKALADGKILVGIRSVKGMDEQKKKIVMEKITEFEAKGYASFLDFYNKNISFTSQLVEELKGLQSADFKKDFAKAYEAQSGLIVGKFDGWTFGAQNVVAGEYNTNLVFDWNAGKESPKISVEMDLNRALGAVDANYAQNMLFYFPINGSVGLEGGLLKRDGYGVLPRPAKNLPSQFFRFNHYSDSAPQLDPFLYLVEQTNAKYKNDYDKQSKGVIFKLTKSEIMFQPTDPIGLLVTIRKTTQPSQNAGILYSLNAGTAVVSADRLIEWNFSKDEIAQEKLGFEFDKKFAKKTLCGNEDELFNGFVFRNGKQGDTVMKTVLFVPTRYGSGVGNSVFKVYCAKDSLGPSKFVDVASGKNAGAKPLDITDNILNNANNDRMLDTYTLKNLVEMLNDDSKLICATVKNNEVILQWNKEMVLERLG